ncbi:hypothetical protein QTN25_008748 [Entamoeba marina]
MECDDECQKQVFERLKGWCGLSCGNIIFDSDVDGENTKQLIRKVLQKKHLYFICFDEDGNVLGGYVNEETKKEVGRIAISTYDKPNQMFRIKKNERALFMLDNPTWLIRLGDDICVWKTRSKSSWCIASRYDYGTNSDVWKNLRSEHDFRSERLVIIEMSDNDN